MYIAIEAIGLGVITIAVLTFGLIVLARRQYDLMPRLIFFLQTIFGAAWTIASIIRLVTTDANVSFVTAKVVYITATALLCSWFILAIAFSKLRKFTLAALGFSLASLVILAVGVIIPEGVMIESVAAPPDRVVFFGPAGWVYPMYVAIFGFLTILMLTINFFTAKNRLERTRHLYILIAAALCITIIGISDVFLPFMGIFDIYWLGPFMLALLVFMMSIAMFRYRLFSLPSSTQNRLDDSLVVDVSLHAVSDADPQKMLNKIVVDIVNVDRISSAAIIVFNNNRLIFSGNSEQSLRLEDLTQIATSNILHNKAIAVEELDISGAEYRLFTSHHITALAIIGQPSSSIFGAVVIGNDASVIYSEKEMAALSSVANIVNIAFESSTYFHRNQELQQLDTAKDELLNIASHNLRTPLVVVRGYIELIMGDKTDAPSEKHLGYLNSADNEIVKMSRIIDDFLTLSRIQTSRFVLNKTPVDLRQMVVDEVSTLQPLAADKDKTFKLDITDGNYSLELDDSKIRQVITNLIDNAIYYSGDSSKITIRLREKNNQAIFEVEDRGIGVPKADREKLWEKFSRASNAQEWRTDGTGTGLYMVRRIIEDHGGTVIYRPLEQGSVFGFSLPHKN
ncbi:ATP-binding protein [Candidatus Saccharibacteria bacterium]|nr:ATP-binding protein [Candidatus Saccharibacteria bacterium]